MRTCNEVIDSIGRSKEARLEPMIVRYPLTVSVANGSPVEFDTRVRIHSSDYSERVLLLDSSPSNEAFFFFQDLSLIEAWITERACLASVLVR